MSNRTTLHAFLVLAALTTFGSARAQHYGYLGKKNYLDVKTVSHVPVVANIVWFFNDGYGSFREWSFGAFNTGVHVNAGRAVKPNLGISFEAGMDFMSNDVFDEEETAIYRSQIRCLSVMPKIEFSTGNGMLPLGVSHQIGVGYYKLSSTYILDDATYEFKPMNGVTLMYAFCLRSSLTRNLFVNYGARYTFNYTYGTYSEITDYWGEYWVLKNNKTEMNAQKRFNFVNVELGLSYVF